jgi:hypothetical protein
MLWYPRPWSTTTMLNMIPVLNSSAKSSSIGLSHASFAHGLAYRRARKPVPMPRGSARRNVTNACRTLLLLNRSLLTYIPTAMSSPHCTATCMTMEVSRGSNGIGWKLGHLHPHPGTCISTAVMPERVAWRIFCMS